MEWYTLVNALPVMNKYALQSSAFRLLTMDPKRLGLGLGLEVRVRVRTSLLGGEMAEALILSSLDCLQEKNVQFLNDLAGKTHHAGDTWSRGK